MSMTDDKYDEYDYTTATEQWCSYLTEDFKTSKAYIYPTMLVMKYFIILLMFPIALVMYSD